MPLRARHPDIRSGSPSPGVPGEGDRSHGYRKDWVARASTLARGVLLITLIFFTLPSFADQPTVVVVLGAEGAPEFAPQFTTWADRWKSAATQAKANFILLGSADSSDSPTDKQKLQDVLSKQSAG